jgi:RNA polymerase sigma-70 factor, ECF subfamily
MTAALPNPLRTAEMPDAQLVTRVLEGDDAAYGTLVHRHQDLIYRHARGMGLDHDTSLDLVQDAFVRAYDRLEDCRDGASYRAWLFRICRNLCLDELRSVRRLAVPLSAIEHADGLEDTRGSEDELTLTLRAALDRLPSALRQAFLLKHDAGYTYDEVADITESSPSAVKMRVHRAREALRAFLIEQGVMGGTLIEFDNGRDNSGVAKRLTNEGQNHLPNGARPNVVRASHSRRMSS